MPRGIYDRSKMKKAAVPQAGGIPVAPKATKTGKGVTWKNKAVEAKSAMVPMNYTGGQTAEGTARPMSLRPMSLYDHMAQLKETRIGLSGPSLEHNPKLLQVIDSEIIDTIGSLKSWRETNFPVYGSDKTPLKPEKMELPPPPPTAPPISQFQPAPPQPPNTLPSPPLPFTPQAVQDVMKHQS